MSGVSFQYIDGEGGTFNLATASCRKLMGFDGVGMVSPEHFWQALPDEDGAEHLGARTPLRYFHFVVKTAGTSRTDCWEEKQAWADAFNIDKGRGRVLATLPDSTQREIPCRFAGGVDFSTEDAETHYMQDFPVQLVADCPHWEDPTDATGTASFNGTAAVSLSCTNDGDVATWPTFTITSTVEHPVLSLAGAGTIDVDLTVGGTLTVNCDTPSVTLDGADMMGSVTATSTFFSLARGANTVQLTATSGSGAVTATWTEKYIALKP